MFGARFRLDGATQPAPAAAERRPPRELQEPRRGAQEEEDVIDDAIEEDVVFPRSTTMRPTPDSGAMQVDVASAVDAIEDDGALTPPRIVHTPRRVSDSLSIRFSAPEASAPRITEPATPTRSISDARFSLADPSVAALVPGTGLSSTEIARTFRLPAAPTSPINDSPTSLRKRRRTATGPLAQQLARVVNQATSDRAFLHRSLTAEVDERFPFYVVQDVLQRADDRGSGANDHHVIVLCEPIALPSGPPPQAALLEPFVACLVPPEGTTVSAEAGDRLQLVPSFDRLPATAEHPQLVVVARHFRLFHVRDDPGHAARAAPTQLLVARLHRPVAGSA